MVTDEPEAPETAADACDCHYGHGRWHMPTCPHHPNHGPDVCTVNDMMLTGASYRQIDYWIRAGYLGDEAMARPHGSGHPRRFTWADRDQVAAMLAFIAAGFTTARAAELATLHNDAERPNVIRTPGLTITWEATPS